MNETCKTSQVLLDRFLTDELSSQELKILEIHLESCAHCQQVIEGEPFEKSLKNLPPLKCPDRVIRQVQAAIQKEKAKARHTHMLKWHWRQTVMAGLVAAATVVVLTLFPDRSIHEEKPAQYTEEEIEQAREVMKWTMAYTAQKMKRSETKVIDDVFTSHLPKSVQKSVRKVLPILKGE
ncbi:zf-HC2 domain-containing protein [bacterium]|nr:zf-HC2 domain-containing protein [bacterium]